MMRIAHPPAARDGFIERRAPAHLLDILAEIADGEPLRHGDLALIGIFLADNHAEERRLARPIRPDQPDALAGIQLKRGVDEDELLAILLVDRGEGNHYGKWVRFWCPGRDSNPHSRCRETDFKSVASAGFATRAGAARFPDSIRRRFDQPAALLIATPFVFLALFFRFSPA